MIYYTSDLHLFHKKILQMCKRPFDTIDDMHLAFVRKWNAKVKADDDVYILGDFAYTVSKKDVEDLGLIISMLNGKKHLICGNHEEWLDLIKDPFKYFESINVYLEIKDLDRDVVLFHYPIEEWNGYYRDAYHLYGHVHIMKINKMFRRYHVGVDTNDYEPKTLDELILQNRG